MSSQGCWGIIVWALGCPAKCWGSQLCLERVLQRILLRTEFFWKLLGQGNTWGVCWFEPVLLPVCSWNSAWELLVVSMWEQAQELSFWAALTHGKLGRAGSQTYSLELTSALLCPWGSQERLGLAKMDSAGTSPWHRQGRGWGRERLNPVQTLQAGQWESCASRGQKCLSVSFTGPKICNFRIFVCSFTLHQRH